MQTRERAVKKIILISLLFLIGCARTTIEANVPFVDIDETMKLEFGMSQYEVQNIMGIPLFIKSGDENEVEWAYEIRYEVIESTKRDFDYIASKKGQFVDYSEPQSTLIAVFKDKKLVRWYTDNGNSGDSNRKLSKFESIIPSEILFGAILPTLIIIGLLE